MKRTKVLEFKKQIELLKKIGDEGRIIANNSDIINVKSRKAIATEEPCLNRYRERSLQMKSQSKIK